MRPRGVMVSLADVHAVTTRLRRPLRVCMLTYSFYESDTRILQYATALAGRGDTVDVIALRRDEGLRKSETVNGVNVYRIQSRVRDEKSVLSYATRILRFLLRSTLFLAKLHQEHPYDIIHVHNVPDFLVFAALYPKWKGVPVILDIHDLLPELYASKFKVSYTCFIFRLLTLVERCCATFAAHIIVANHLWRDRLVARSSREDKCSVVRNYPDLDIFAPQVSESRPKGGRFMCIYPGSLNWHQGLDVAIRAFAAVADQMGDAEFHIYGEGPAKASLFQLSRDLGIQDRIIFHDVLPLREVAKIMAGADLGIEPKRATSAFGNEALSTKILEFMALGVPVIASRTRTHVYYYDDSIVKYYDADNQADLAAAMVLMRQNADVRRDFAKRASQYAAENNWQVRKDDYLRLIDRLTVGRTSPVLQPSSAA